MPISNNSSVIFTAHVSDRFRITFERSHFGFKEDRHTVLEYVGMPDCGVGPRCVNSKTRPGVFTTDRYSKYFRFLKVLGELHFKTSRHD